MYNKFRKIVNILHTHCTRDNAFTIIELLTATAIISILSVLVFANVGEGRRRQALDRAAQQLALDIRKVQNLSLAPSNTPSCMYGLKMNIITDTYFLYYDADCNLPNYQYNASSVQLDPPGIISFKDDISINSSGVLDIAFQSPEPITYLDGNNSVAGDLIITLSTLGGVTKNVIINRFGRVEIQ